MRTYQYVYFPFFQFLKGLFFLFGRFETVDIINVAREIFQPLAEGLKMLESKNGSRHQYSSLLTVAYGFKCSTYGNLCFTKSHIAAYKPVHRGRRFHVAFYIGSSLALIRGILIYKRCFQFSLQVAIRCMCKTL